MSFSGSYEQEMTFQEQRRREAMTEQERADEEFARQLVEEERQEAERGRRAQRVDSAGTVGRVVGSAQPTQFLTSGQSASVKFNHVATGSHLGEVLVARSTGPSVMMFEVAHTAGRYLSVTGDGVVEFGAATDDRARFNVRVHGDGSISLGCVAHRGKHSMAGPVGWFLALTSEGRLIGNAPDDASARWRLIRPDPAPAAHTTSSVTPHHPHSHSTANTNPKRGMLPGAGQSVPDVYDTPEAQLRWLGSDPGLDYLARTPELMQMFFDATLRPRMYRPDWPLAALRWRDYREREARDSSRYGLPSAAGSTDLLVDMQGGGGHAASGRFDTAEEYTKFKDNGYAVLSAVVPPEVLRRAKRVAVAAALDPSSPLGEQRTVERDWSGGGGTCVSVKGPLLCDTDIMALYYDSGVHAVVQRLVNGLSDLHGTAVDKVDPVLSASDVRIRPPQLVDPQEDIYAPTEGVGSSRQPEGTRWKLDGFTSSGGHSPYTLLVGVTLEDAHGNTGQLAVFPGSHVILNHTVRNLMLNGSFTELVGFSDPSAPKKPDLCAAGQSGPVQLRLKAGDAVILTGKLAHREEANFGEGAQTMVYFTVSHVDHSRLRVGALDRWTAELALMDSISPSSPPAAHSTHSSRNTSNDNNSHSTASDLPQAVVVAPSPTAAPYSPYAPSNTVQATGTAYSSPPPPYPPQSTQRQTASQHIIEEEDEEQDTPFLDPSVVSTDGRSEDTFNLFENMAVHGQGEQNCALNPVHDATNRGGASY